jgi:hypothetical protein
VEAGQTSIVEVKTRDGLGLLRREVWMTREVQDITAGDLVEDPRNQAGERVLISEQDGPFWHFKMTGGYDDRRGMDPRWVFWSLKPYDIKHGPVVGPSNDEAPEFILVALRHDQFGWADKDTLSYELMIPVQRVASILRSLRREGKVEVNVVRGGYQWHRTEDCSEFCRHVKRRTT